MKKITIIGVLTGAAVICATPISLNQSPTQRVENITEFRGSKNRAAVDTWECCWRQPASAPQSISPLRVWRYLLLSCALLKLLRTTSEFAFHLRLLARPFRLPVGMEVEMQSVFTATSPGS